MINFKPILLEDKELIDSYFKINKQTACDYCFTNLYIWKHQYNFHYAIVEGLLVIKLFDNGLKFYFPVGDYSKYSIKKTIFDLYNYAKSMDKPLKFAVSTSAHLTLIIENKNHFSYTVLEDKGHYDYVYNSEDLANLSGKKYHQKRNHMKKFLSYNYTFETLTEKNVTDCIEMNNIWCIQHNCLDDDNNSKKEYCAVRSALNNAFKLNLKGYVLKVDDTVVAFCVGSILNDDTFVIHIEKGLISYNGVYPAINNLTAQNLTKKFRYINREDDLGIEGLRKAKLSYYPDHLTEKYTITIDKVIDY